MNLAQIFRGLFGDSKRHYCSFCGKHHSAVAKLIAGRDCSICNECVLICSSVLMNQCEEYRKNHIDKIRDLLAKRSGTEPAAAPKEPQVNPDVNG